MSRAFPQIPSESLPLKTTKLSWLPAASSIESNV